MSIASRRVRTEERKLIKRVIITLASVGAAVIFVLYIGLPFLARILLIGVKQSAPESTNQTALFPPVFDPILEATNSGIINLSGYAQASSEVEIYINEKEYDTVHVDENGKFTAIHAQLKEGKNTITGYSKKENERSEVSATSQITYKKGEPTLDISSPHDGDHFSSEQRTIVIKGVTDPDNRVMVNDRMAVMDVHGGFSLSYRLNDGDNTLTIIAQDPAGNQIKKEEKVSYSP